MRLQSGTLADRLTCWSYSAAGRAGLVHEASPVLTLTLRSDAEGRYTYQYQVDQRAGSMSRGSRERPERLWSVGGLGLAALLWVRSTKWREVGPTSRTGC